MLKKWWVILIQGILLVLLGIFIFRNPVEVLGGISLWFGIIVLITGIIGIIAWIFSKTGERDSWSLIWSLLSLIFGILMLTNVPFIMKAITVIFGIWVVIAGLNLFFSGWSLRSENATGWVLLVVGILAIVAGVMMVLNVNEGIEGFATILGLQVLLTGLAYIMLSVIKKSILSRLEAK